MVGKFKHQVAHSKLEDPVAVGRFHNDGFGSAGELNATEYMKELEKAGIEFAAVSYSPPIIIYVAEKDVPKMEEKGIDVGRVYDPR